MYLSIDVETNGLYGEAFAVGYVLTKDSGEVLLEGIHCCPIDDSLPDPQDTTPLLTSDFMEKNVLPALPPCDRFTTRGVRQKFLDVWKSAHRYAEQSHQSLYIVADVAYPCETGFLRQVRMDDSEGIFTVYPLIDLSSILLVKGYNPIATLKRNPDELPAHNPLNDARQTSRIFHALIAGNPID